MPRKHIRKPRYSKIKTMSSSLHKSIAKSLKMLRRRSGGGRLDAWQDKYPQYPGDGWATAPTICQFPEQAKAAFNGPVQKGGGCGCGLKRGGGYGVSETYFGRRPVGYTGPRPSPYPASPILTGAGRSRRSARKMRKSRKSRKMRTSRK